MSRDNGRLFNTGDGSLELLSLFSIMKTTQKSDWFYSSFPQPIDSISDHSYGVVLAAVILAQLDPSLNKATLLELALLHHCCEGTGDSKLDAAHRFDTLLQQSGVEPIFAKALSRVEEKYDSPEASAVRQLDRLETMLRAAECERLHWGTSKEVRLDHVFDLSMSLMFHPVIKRWADEIIDSRPFSNVERGKVTEEESAYQDVIHSVEKGIRGANTQLAWHLLSGSGGAVVDEDQAVVLLEEQVKDGNAEAMWMLGVCCEHGIGTEQDCGRAQRLYKRASQMGSSIGGFLSSSYCCRFDRIYVDDRRFADVIDRVLLIKPCARLYLMNDFGKKAAFKICKLLMSNTSLTKLVLRSHAIGGEVMSKIGEALKRNSTLTTLEIQRSRFESLELEELSKSLMVNTSLTKLDLRGCEIRAKGTKLICDALINNNTIGKLNLGYNFIGVEGAAILSEFLKMNTTLTSLDLSQNFSPGKGLTEICESLMGNTTLNKLVLSGNGMTDEGAAKISEFLLTNNTLTKLVLSRNSITSEGVIKICESLMVNTTMDTLDLSWNRINNPGARKIGKLLETNVTLTYLNIQQNTIKYHGKKWITESLMKNTTLTQLYM